jgi:hypothetical protein
VTAPVAADYYSAGDYESALLIGVAELLHNELGWSYNGAGSFPVLSIGSTPDAPDRVCILDTYGDGWQDPTNPVGTILMQLRHRSRKDVPLDTKLASGQAFSRLHNRRDTVIGGLFVPTIYRDTHANLGRDTVSRRWERTDNYSFTVDYPVTGQRQ